MENKRIGAHIHASTLAPSEGRILPSHARLVRDLFGSVGWDSFARYLSGAANAEALPVKPTSDFLFSMYGDRKPEGILGKARQATLSILHKLHISHSYYDNEFRDDYQNAQQVANEAIIEIITKLGLPRDIYGLRDGVTAVADSPGVSMRKILLPPEKINPIYRHQLFIQQLMTVAALELDMSLKKKKMNNELSDFVAWAEEELFSGMPDSRLGDTQSVAVYSLHKPNTNWAGEHNIRVNQPFARNEVWDNTMKKKDMETRKCVIDGEQFTLFFDTRIKRSSVALIKAIAKADRRSVKRDKRINTLIRKEMHSVRRGDNEYESKKHTATLNAINSPIDKDPAQNAKRRREESDEIFILDDVVDIIGTKIVVVEGDKKRFVELFEGKLKGKYGEENVVDDSTTGKERGQSSRNSFTRKVLANGAGTEMIIYSLQEYINSENDIGVIDKNSLPNGASHRIYELLRMAAVAKRLFPKEIYPNLDIDHYLRLALQKVIQDLRKEGNIDPI